MQELRVVLRIDKSIAFFVQTSTEREALTTWQVRLPSLWGQMGCNNGRLNVSKIGGSALLFSAWLGRPEHAVP